MPETKKSYWKSLEERDALLDPSLPAPKAMPEGGVFEEGVGSGLAGLVEEAGELRMDRAAFLKLVGFSFAGAALAGCGKAAEKALPYLVAPEEVVPGKANYYATVCGGCSAACGALAKDRNGRPIKLEGNPQHPLNRGALCAMGQASLLGVYDTQRLKAPRIEGKEVSWAELDKALLAELKSLKGRGGKLRLLSRSIVSPSLRSQAAAFLAGFPGSRLVQYDPLSASAILDAHQQTHGLRALPHYRFEQAEVIVAFEADFLGTWISPVEFAAGYQAGRRLEGREGRFSKHFQVESGLSLSGSKADRRWTVKPSQLPLALAHLAVRLGAPAAWAAAGPSPLPGEALSEIAKSLRKAAGRGLLVCGSQELEAQLLANWINHSLGNYGRTLDLQHPSLQRQGDDAALAELLKEMEAGQVQALLVLDGDPVGELAQGPALAAAMKKVPLTLSCSPSADDTSALSRYQAPDSHWLESWSDAEPVAGLVGLVQPAMRPLHETRQALESLAAWGGRRASALQLVQAHWRSRVLPAAGKGRSFQAFWDDSLLAGFAETGAGAAAAAGFRSPQIRLAKPAEGLEVAFYPKVALQDGRQASNPWIQEVPDPISKVAWDQIISIHPATAKKLGYRQGDLVKLEMEGGVSLELPLHLQPGQDAATLSVPLGYGRAGTERFHKVGPKWLLAKPVVGEKERLGLNVAPLFTLAGARALPRRGVAKLSGTGRNIELALTQLHQSLEVPEHLAPQAGRKLPIVQELSLKELREGEGAERHEGGEEHGSMYKEHEYPGHRWAMAIDLSACNGCSACVVACQVENNVPVVGRDEVRRAHEMHWIRIDRYYHEGEEGLETVSQPMLCQQCGHAPCEPVCPTNATTHSSEGLNQQTYNRCVGTRYCANNCPYKVRRFNWFDYPALQGSETLALNPDVTVRVRGVMEKCSFCVQRIQEEKAESKRRGENVKDGQIQTACQQTCPAKAISFGDINDPKSRVSQLAKDVRAFKVLEELNVKPSITYLAQVRNKS